MMQNTVDENPFSPSISLTSPVGPFSNPYLGLSAAATPPFHIPAPNNFVFPLPISALTLQPNTNFLVPSSYNWNLTTERQLRRDWMMRLAYVGARGLHLRRDEQVNPVVYDPGAPAPYGNPSLASNSRRLYMPGLTSVGEETESGSSNYHSFQATLEKRMSQGFTILANYIWSKSMDDLPQNQTLQANGSGSFSEPIYDPNFSRFEYGPSPFDHTNVFVASYVWQLPKLSSSPWYLKQFVGGWQWTGIASAQTGDAYTVFAGTDRSATDGNDRAVVTGSPYGGSACKGSGPCRDWLNPDSFSLPLAAVSTPADVYADYPYRYGNAPKGGFRGPGLFNWDMGLDKIFPLRETMALQFRAEFFNALNRVNLSDPDATMSDAGFGSITTSASPRIGQVALKLNF